MPNPGQVNNPEGANSYEPFISEPAYGEVKKQKSLHDAAPLAGGRLAAGPLGAPKQAQRKAVKGPVEQRAAHPAEAAMTPQLGPPPTKSDHWRNIAIDPDMLHRPYTQMMAELA